jgi:hypothetical protein
MTSTVEQNDVDDGDMEMEQEIQIKMTTTGIKSRVSVSESLANSMHTDDNDDEGQPHFPKLSALQANGNRSEYRRVRCPAHRYTPLREHWEQILTPLVEYLKLQVRFLITDGVINF